MKTKTILTALLLVFVGASVVLAALKTGSGKPESTTPGSIQGQPSESTPVPTPGTPAHRVVAYYLHGNKRCPTCVKIQSYSDAVVRQEFAEALADGRLEWHVLNTDEPENAHFVNDYELFAQSVVVTEVRDGEVTDWENLERIWELVSDEAEFKAYVGMGMQAFLDRVSKG